MHLAAKKSAEGDYKAAQEKHIADEADLKNESAMIRMIMRYIGILHDVKATEKSIACGGRESVKNKGNFKFLFCCTLFCFPRDSTPWIDKAWVDSIRYDIIIIYSFIQTVHKLALLKLDIVLE